MAAAPDLVIDDVLEELGYAGETARRARAALEAAGLTNARKQRIAARKREALERVLDEQFLLLCSRQACREAGEARGRVVLDAARPAACAVCHGRPNAAELDRAVAALAARGLHRIVIVGGSPSTQEELRDQIGARLELRLVSGTGRRTARDAKADLAWAQLVVIWGATELDHSISELYRGGPSTRVVTCRRRGIEAMAGTLAAAARSGR